MALVVVISGLLAAVGRAAAGTADHAPAPSRHLVQAGDTLWAIARGLVGGEGDPRPMVEELRDLNGLGSAPLPAGTTLVLP